MACIHTRGARAPTPTHPRQAHITHQPGHPLTAHPTSPGHQLGMNPRHPVGTPRLLVDGADRAAQHLVALRTMRAPTAPPRVVSAGGDTQHPAHRGHRMFGLVALTSPKTSRAPCRSPEQTRPRLFLRSRAPREAGDSPDAAGEAPQPRCSSNRPHDALRLDRSDVPNCGSSERSTRTRVPALLPSALHRPTRPRYSGASDMGTPPLHSVEVSTEPGAHRRPQQPNVRQFATQGVFACMPLAVRTLVRYYAKRCTTCTLVRYCEKRRGTQGARVHASRPGVRWDQPGCANTTCRAPASPGPLTLAVHRSRSPRSLTAAAR